MAKASQIYTTELCHFVFMGNHFHFIIRVVNPDDVQASLRYIKSEIAHAINRLLGRRQRTIWKERYDSPLVLDDDKLKSLVTYLYLNPARANLVDTIDEYPGVSSWEMFKSGNHLRKCKKIPRNKIKKLHSASIPVSEQKELVKRYELHSKQFELKLEPFSCFKALRCERDTLHQEIITEVYKEEARLRKERKFEPFGPTTLRRQSMLKEHTPTKHSPKMICLSTDKDLRKALIEHYKSLCYLATKIYESWKLGELSLKIPLGLYSPRVPTLVTLLQPM